MLVRKYHPTKDPGVGEEAEEGRNRQEKKAILEEGIEKCWGRIHEF